MFKLNVTPGQIYRHPRRKDERVIIERFERTGAKGEEMWKFAGQTGDHNVELLVKLGYLELYANNVLNHTESQV